MTLSAETKSYTNETTGQSLFSVVLRKNREDVPNRAELFVGKYSLEEICRIIEILSRNPIIYAQKNVNGNSKLGSRRGMDCRQLGRELKG